MEVIHFDADDSFEIKGRGTVYTGPAPFELPLADRMADFRGRPVHIQFAHHAGGNLWRVVGVETHAINAPIRKGRPIGLLVQPW